jgi:hypothetical protein
VSTSPHARPNNPKRAGPVSASACSLTVCYSQAVTKRPRQQPCDVERVVKRAVMRSGERQADQLARFHHAYLLANPLRFRKQVLRVLMRQDEWRGDAMPLAVVLELLPIVCAPAYPD